MAKWINAHQNSSFVKWIGYRSSNQMYSTKLYRFSNHVKLNLKVYTQYYKQFKWWKFSLCLGKFFSTLYMHMASYLYLNIMTHKINTYEGDMYCIHWHTSEFSDKIFDVYLKYLWTSLAATIFTTQTSDIYFITFTVSYQYKYVASVYHCFCKM